MTTPSRALIGYTGFVGTTLRDQVPVSFFTHLYNSTNINDITASSAPTEFELVVCAGISAVKWYANKHPDEDLARIKSLMESVKNLKTKKFILISTVDVYTPIDGQLDESAPLKVGDTHAYGNHRLLFEQYVQDTWPGQYIIVRLPGLFGPHLRKNVLYDLVHDFKLANINPNQSLQWYPMVRLWADIERVIQVAAGRGVTCINLFTEPLENGVIIAKFFPQHQDAVNTSPNLPRLQYDTCTKYADVYTGREDDRYIMRRDEVLEEMGKFFATAKDTTSPPLDA